MDDFWEELEGKISGLVEEAGDKTDKKLSSEISSLTKLTNEQIIELFPESSDVEKLFELIRLVKEDTNRNEKINNLVADAEKFAGVLITIVSNIS